MGLSVIPKQVRVDNSKFYFGFHCGTWQKNFLAKLSIEERHFAESIFLEPTIFFEFD